MTVPAQYAKFITALLGAGIAYLTAYGTTWNLQGALVSAGAALAVFGVPNAAAPPMTVAQVGRPRVPSGNVTVTAATPPVSTATGSYSYTPSAGPPEPPAPPAGPAGVSA